MVTPTKQIMASLKDKQPSHIDKQTEDDSISRQAHYGKANTIQ